jgi:hypothetical protein
MRGAGGRQDATTAATLNCCDSVRLCREWPNIRRIAFGHEDETSIRLLFGQSEAAATGMRQDRVLGIMRPDAEPPIVAADEVRVEVGVLR